jgi:ferredoxin hydrogenase
MFTSCCPAWIRFAKLFYPRLLPNLSTVKSPLLMQGALVKTYFAQKMGIDPANIVSVALTPCTAKKAEILLPGKNAAGIAHGRPQMRDVDYVLTCRELAYLLNINNVNFLQMQDAPYSPLMGTGSGAGMIFGNSGGVMEASLRTAYRLLNNRNPPADFFNLSPIRGLESVRRASVDLGKRTLNVAVVHGTGESRPFLESIQSGALQYDFIEFMACSGGCIGGGGQPVNSMAPTRLKQLRMNALYQRDTNKVIRLSYDNPQIKAIYSEFLGEPLGMKAKELLHISHTK